MSNPKRTKNNLVYLILSILLLALSIVFGVGLVYVSSLGN